MKTILTALTILCCSLLTAAQTTCAPDSSIVISLLTCAPGSDIYELEGHSGLRIKSHDADWVANWGLFDFDSPGFVYRFVKGETDYMAGIIPTPLFLNTYQRQHRRVTEQTLNLSPAQAAEVARLVMENIRPENRVYRYNYVRDNCATRPLALIERATGDSIALPPLPPPSSSPTWRSWMQHYHTNYPWYQFGIDLALGSGIDQPITTRQVAFAPASLALMASRATLISPSGSRPLVTSETILIPGNPQGNQLPPTPWWLTPLATTTLILLIAIILSIRDLRRRHLSRWFDLSLYTTLSLISLILTFLIFISVHEATTPNWLYLWINPLLIPIAILSCIPRRYPRLLIPLQLLNLLGIATFIILTLASIQYLNPALIPLLAADTLRAIVQITILKRPSK